MKSLWCRDVQLPKGRKLEGDLRCKNVVIGAGMAGCLIAYLLQEKGQEVIVLEAKEIASGQTKNTTAKITSQHGLKLYDMIRLAGYARAKGYVDANEAAIKKYKKIIEKDGISCHFEEMPSFLYTIKSAGVAKLKQEEAAAQSLGLKAEFLTGEKIEELPFGVKGALKFEQQAQFHPLEFLNAIAENLTIYEHIKVLEVEDHFVVTETGVIVAENVIFATHYPFPITPGWFFLRQHQSRSYVLALEGEGVPEELAGMYYGIEKEDFSFRCAQGKLIFGGSGHRTGKQFALDTKHGKKKYPGGFCYLREKANEYYPEAKERFYWSAQDCMTHDGIPFIGKYTKEQEHWYVATGFGKWGMTSSMIAAMIISDSIVGVENPYAWVFSPQRLLIRAGAKDFFIDAWESVLGLGRGLFVKKEKKCSHMGCALNWNEEEKTWDCSCHGSRYDEEGRLIDNPAQDVL